MIFPFTLSGKLVFAGLVSLTLLIGGGGFLHAAPPNDLPTSFFLMSDVTLNQPGTRGTYNWDESSQRYIHSAYTQNTFNWTGSTFHQKKFTTTYQTNVSITCTTETTGIINGLTVHGTEGTTSVTITGSFPGCYGVYKATIFINNPNLIQKELTIYKLPAGYDEFTQPTVFDTWNAPPGESAHITTGFELGSCMFVVYQSNTLASHCFTGIEGGPASDVTLYVDVPLGELIDLTVYNSLSNVTSATFSVWSSVHGFITLGQTIEPGQILGVTPYELQPYEQVKVIINGVDRWKYTAPASPVAVVKMVWVTDPVDPETPPSPTPPTDDPPPNSTPDPNSTPQIDPTITPPTNIQNPWNPSIDPGGDTTSANMTKDDFYDAMRGALEDALGGNSGALANAPTLSEVDTQAAVDGAGELGTVADDTFTQFQNTVAASNTVMESGRELFSSLAPPLGEMGTATSYTFFLPKFGNLTIDFGTLPGLNILRWTVIFFVWFMTGVFSIHIIRSAIY